MQSLSFSNSKFKEVSLAWLRKMFSKSPKEDWLKRVNVFGEICFCPGLSWSNDHFCKRFLRWWGRKRWARGALVDVASAPAPAMALWSDLAPSHAAFTSFTLRVIQIRHWGWHPLLTQHSRSHLWRCWHDFSDCAFPPHLFLFPQHDLEDVHLKLPITALGPSGVF